MFYILIILHVTNNMEIDNLMRPWWLEQVPQDSPHVLLMNHSITHSENTKIYYKQSCGRCDTHAERDTADIMTIFSTRRASYIVMSVCPLGFRPGTSNFIGRFVMACRWPKLILRSVGQRSHWLWIWTRAMRSERQCLYVFSKSKKGHYSIIILKPELCPLLYIIASANMCTKFHLNVLIWFWVMGQD